MVVVWILRNNIIRELSGSLLAKYDLEIIDVSLDALAANDASIGHLELRHTGGARIAIDELNLGVRKSAEGRRRYSADRVTITLPDSSEDRPSSVATVIRQVAGLPDSLPLVDVVVTELLITGYPVVNDLTWSTYDDRQSLGAHIEQDSIRLELERLATDRYEAQIKLATGDDIHQSVRIGIEDLLGLVRLRADATLQLAAIEHLLERFRILPDGVDFESAAAGIVLLANMPDDAAQPLQLDIEVATETDWRFRYDDITIVLALPDVLEISAALPDKTWQMGAAGVGISISNDVAQDVIVLLADVDCRTGIACSAKASASTGLIALPNFSARKAMASATLELELDTDGRMRGTAAPGATIALTRIAAGNTRVARLAADFVTAIDLFRDGSGWKLSADSIDVDMDRVADGDLTLESSLFLDKAGIESKRGRVVARTGVYAPAIYMTYADSESVLPGVRGGAAFQDHQITAELETVGLKQDGQVRASHDFSSGAGAFSVAGLVSAFEDRPLSSLLVTAPPAFDLTAGTLGIDLRIDWRSRRPPRGSLSAQLLDVAGFYTTIAFAGVTTVIDFDYDQVAGITTNPSELSATFIDVGVPLRDIVAHYQLRLDTTSVDISSLRLAAFGGTITSDPFSFGKGSKPDDVRVHVKSLDIAEVMTIKEFEAVDVTGKVDAELPMTIGASGVTIDGGRLTGVPPGGVINYRAGLDGPQTDASAMGIAARALSNFQYESLTADVAYTEAGDLMLQMQLRGRNPDMQGSRPIVLNLGIENNVPDMLRSLQASRSVKDVLERRVNR